MVYTTEAHAADVWPIGMSAGTINMKHKTLEDRKAAAEKFSREFSFAYPIYLDNMKNEFETGLKSWPFRYYLIHDGRFEFIPVPVNSFFEIGDLFSRI